MLGASRCQVLIRAMVSKMNQVTCPVERTLNILGNRWVTLVVWHLLDGRKRFGQLKATVPGISGKILTDRLRELEAHGFVTREMFAEVPVRVEYELTERGRSLHIILDAMCAWDSVDALRATPLISARASAAD
jgi:DNA-binding HxlR family transcriptional regulator